MSSIYNSLSQEQTRCLPWLIADFVFCSNILGKLELSSSNYVKYYNGIIVFQIC